MDIHYLDILWLSNKILQIQNLGKLHLRLIPYKILRSLHSLFFSPKGYTFHSERLLHHVMWDSFESFKSVLSHWLKYCWTATINVILNGLFIKFASNLNRTFQSIFLICFIAPLYFTALLKHDFYKGCFYLEMQQSTLKKTSLLILLITKYFNF